MATPDSPTPCTLFSEEDGTRYALLSALYDPYVHSQSAITQTIAAFSPPAYGGGVVLHRLSSDDTPARFDLSREAMAALITAYTAHCIASEQHQGQDSDPLGDLDDHPF